MTKAGGCGAKRTTMRLDRIVMFQMTTMMALMGAFVGNLFWAALPKIEAEYFE